MTEVRTGERKCPRIRAKLDTNRQAPEELDRFRDLTKRQVSVPEKESEEAEKHASTKVG